MVLEFLLLCNVLSFPHHIVEKVLTHLSHTHPDNTLFEIDRGKIHIHYYLEHLHLLLLYKFQTDTVLFRKQILHFAHSPCNKPSNMVVKQQLLHHRRETSHTLVPGPEGDREDREGVEDREEVEDREVPWLLVLQYIRGCLDKNHNKCLFDLETVVLLDTNPCNIVSRVQ